MNAGYCILKICVRQVGMNIAVGINSRIAAVPRLALATSIKAMGINARMLAILAMYMNAVGINSVPIRGLTLSLVFVQDKNADSLIMGQI